MGGSSALVSMWQEDNMTIPGSWITGTCCLRKVELNHVVLRRCIQGVLQVGLNIFLLYSKEFLFYVNALLTRISIDPFRILTRIILFSTSLSNS